MARHHKFPRCPDTGKVRFGERKDVRLVLADAAHARSRASRDGVTSNRHEVRGYECQHCRGWHLTSQPVAA